MYSVRGQLCVPRRHWYALRTLTLVSDRTYEDLGLLGGLRRYNHVFRAMHAQVRKEAE